jgi:hypothetical protein
MTSPKNKSKMKYEKLKKMNALVIVLIMGITACTESEHKSSSVQTTSDKWAEFMKSEVVELSKSPVDITKDITEGESVERQVITLKSQSEWEEELKGFLNFQTESELIKSKSRQTIDSNGMYHIARNSASDTNAYLQEFTVWKVKNEVQILTWKYKTRSFLMDRNVEMSYQPMKGYRLQIWENSVWSTPKQIEIFATFESK